MNTPDPVLVAMGSLIMRVAGAGRTPPDSGPDTPLSDGFWLDSVELLEVLVACEREFGVLFDDTIDFESGALDTLGTLADLIRAKQAMMRHKA